MKITAVSVYGYELRYAHGDYVMSGGRSASTQSGTVVRVRTDEGLDGWGEVTPLGATYLPTFTDGIRTALATLIPPLVGQDPTNLNRVNEVMDRVLLGHGYAKSPIDMACWDLLGRASGRPVVDLLGGRRQADFPLYEAVPLGTPESMAEFVRSRSRAGTTRFQLKVGNDPREDVARTRAARAAAAASSLVVADANGGWNILQAQVAIRELADLDVYVEQPCRHTDECAIAHTGSTLPLVLDESVCTAADVFRARDQAHAGAVNIKIGRVGGLTRAARMRDLLQDLDMMVSVEDMWGGDIVTAAVSHLVASTRPDRLLLTSFFNDWTDGHPAGHQPRSQGGRGSAPTGPGLGIEVDAAALGPALLHVGPRG